MIKKAADGRGFVLTKKHPCGHSQAHYLHRSEVTVQSNGKPIGLKLVLMCRLCNHKGPS